MEKTQKQEFRVRTGEGMKSSRKVCCIAILIIVDQVAAARSALGMDVFGDLEISLLRKPDCYDAGGNFHRMPVVGAVIAEGPIVQFLEAIRPGEDHVFIKGFSAFFDDIGVPETRHQFYLSALKTGHILMILQGSENQLRKACEVLEGICLEKPVLNFS